MYYLPVPSNGIESDAFGNYNNRFGEFPHSAPSFCHEWIIEKGEFACFISLLIAARTGLVVFSPDFKVISWMITDLANSYASLL